MRNYSDIKVLFYVFIYSSIFIFTYTSFHVSDSLLFIFSCCLHPIAATHRLTRSSTWTSSKREERGKPILSSQSYEVLSKQSSSADHKGRYNVIDKWELVTLWPLGPASWDVVSKVATLHFSAAKVTSKSGGGGREHGNWPPLSNGSGYDQGTGRKNQCVGGWVVVAF